MDNLISKVANKFVDRILKLWPPFCTDLDHTTLAKALPEMRHGTSYRRPGLPVAHSFVSGGHFASQVAIPCTKFAVPIPGQFVQRAKTSRFMQVPAAASTAEKLEAALVQ